MRLDGVLPQAHRPHAAREFGEKVAAARKQLAALRAEKATRLRTRKKAAKAKKEPRASTTDAPARRMRFADGGVGAGFDLQFAVSTASHVVVGVRETDRRNDAGFAGSMVEQLERCYGARSARLLAGTRYATRKDLTEIRAQRATARPGRQTMPSRTPGFLHTLESGNDEGRQAMDDHRVGLL